MVWARVVIEAGRGAGDFAPVDAETTAQRWWALDTMDGDEMGWLLRSQRSVLGTAGDFGPVAGR